MRRRMTLWSVIVPSCIATELLLISYYLLLGPYGMRMVWRAYHDACAAQEQMRGAQEHVTQLELALETWRAHSLDKEKIAREQLHMAYPHDILYYVPLGD